MSSFVLLAVHITKLGNYGNYVTNSMIIAINFFFIDTGSKACQAWHIRLKFNLYAAYDKNGPKSRVSSFVILAVHIISADNNGSYITNYMNRHCIVKFRP